MFVLRSKSPRRIQILSDLGFQFNAVPAEIDESSQPGENPLAYLERICKAKSIWTNPSDLALGIDTIVVLGDQILQKPGSDGEAMDILRLLSGRVHSVFSGGCFYENGAFDFFIEKTDVLFFPWNDIERERYLREASPFDKAGSYGIQDRASPVKEWYGSYLNVVGFPIRSFLQRADSWKQYWN